MGNTSELKSTSPASVTDDREARFEPWVAILVQTNCERRVAEKLGSVSMETYVAFQEEMHRWSDRIKKVQRIVIPNIVFVRCPKDRFQELKRYTFVRGIMSHPGSKEPALIPDKQMESLRFMLGQSDNPVFLENNIRRLRIGTKVRVLRGIFVGLEGSICQCADGDLHVGIHLDTLGFAHVKINKTDIQEIL